MRKRFWILTGVLILITLKNAWGEEEKDSKASSVALEPITVTASRIERKLSEVSSSVSIVTEEDINNSNAKSVPDLLKDMEGVYSYDPSGVGTASRMNMRGFWGGMSTYQLVLIDGVPQNKGRDKLVDWDLISLHNIERVEVLRGPASALYGDNAMSGVINIITKKPTRAFTADIFGSYGDFNTQNYNASISGTYKKLGYYIYASGKHTDGFRRYCDYGMYDINGKANLLIDETQSLNLSAGYHDKRRGAYPWAVEESQLEEDKRRERPGTEDDSGRTKKVDTSITYNKKIGEMFNIEGTFYYRYEYDDSFYTSGSTEASTKKQLESESAYGLPLRLSAGTDIFGIKNFFIIGIDLERDDVGYKQYMAPYQEKGNILSDYGITKDTIGPYIQDEISLIDPLKIIAGLRYDFIEFDFGDHMDNSESKTRTMSKFTPKCGVVYTYQEYSNVYANYAQAFRTPAIGQMFTYRSHSNPDLNPEKATNYEIGIRHYFTDWLKGNMALYWMDLDDEIWYDLASEQYKNYGTTSHRGIETAFEFKIIEGLTGFVNYAYTDAKNTSGENKGKYLANIPINKWGYGGRFETDFGLNANITVTKMGDTYIDAANDDKLSGYTTVDIKINYTYKWLTVFLAIDNVLNEGYYVYGYKVGNQQKYFNSAPKRTFTFGGNLKF